MFTKTKSETMLDDEIRRLLSYLSDCAPMTDEYVKIMDRIDRLQKMKTAETRSSPRVSPDTLLTASTNILGIWMILRHEHAGHFISSKALGFVQKAR